jgi:hypothetical protein
MILSLLFSLMLSMGSPKVIDRPATDPKPTPMMRTVEPVPAKAGEAVMIKGDHLSKDYITAVYISDGGKDRQVTLETQTEEAVSFRVPAELKPGTYKVIVLINAVEPLLIEEPVRLIVSE